MAFAKDDLCILQWCMETLFIDQDLSFYQFGFLLAFISPLTAPRERLKRSRAKQRKKKEATSLKSAPCNFQLFFFKKKITHARIFTLFLLVAAAELQVMKSPALTSATASSGDLRQASLSWLLSPISWPKYNLIMLVSCSAYLEVVHACQMLGYAPHSPPPLESVEGYMLDGVMFLPW